MAKKIKEVNDDVSEQIWKYVWDNADNDDTDDDLCNEHTDLCNRYENGEHLKFVVLKDEKR